MPTFFAHGSPTTVISDDDLRAALIGVYQKLGAKKKVLAVPPDFTRFNSRAGIITQYTYLLNEEGYIPPVYNNLPIIPYFYLLAGPPQVMRDFRDALDASGSRGGKLFGRHVDRSRITDTHVAWLEKQVGRLERAVGGAVSNQVRDYFEVLRRFVRRRDALAAAATTSPVVSGSAPGAVAYGQAQP